jgi:hypothetical protein
MGLLYGRTGCLTTKNGDFWPGQYTVSDADSVAQGTPAAQGFCCTSAQECAAPESTENLVHALSITFDTDGQHADITATALTEAKVVNGTSHMGSYVPFSCKSEVTMIQGKIVSFPDSSVPGRGG